MACRNAYRTKTTISGAEKHQTQISEPFVAQNVSRLYFGVDSEIQSNDLLQNNINMFEWVIRNKVHPNFYGRNITGDNALTKDEMKFIHSKGTKIAVIYSDSHEKETETQGKETVAKIDKKLFELGIPEQTAIFLDIEEGKIVTTDFMRGYAKALMEIGYTPAFKANTDAAHSFDREFSRGMQSDKDVFSKCLIWSVAPTVKEYDGMTTTHLIHPDVWKPFAPSGITRERIAVWTYGKNCHPIADDDGRATVFNLNLVRNKDVIMKKMF